MLLLCRFISEFLGSLHPETRKALAAVATLEVYKKDQVSQHHQRRAVHQQ